MVTKEGRAGACVLEAERLCARVHMCLCTCVYVCGICVCPGRQGLEGPSSSQYSSHHCVRHLGSPGTVMEYKEKVLKVEPWPAGLET